MLSRSGSPSQLRNTIEDVYSIPSTYNNVHVVQESQASLSADSMGRTHNSLDIVLASDRLILRGTSSDVEPCTLSGNVVLNLVEATIFKEITMQLKGKSRVPQVQIGEGSSSILGGGYQTNLLYSYDWSFLEGELKHSPTLKAGRHVFPFKLQLEGHLPSSLSTHAGESAISYKLRATAVRPVFASNLHATIPIRILRSFSPEALEYQQTLELENTWPEKMMYSLMVPHKAWAAGDTVKVLAKFSPLVKGVHIKYITTTVQEHVKLFAKFGPSHDTTRVIATARHDIRNKQAETTQLNDPSRSVVVTRHPTPPSTAPGSPTLSGVYSPIPEGTSLLDPVGTQGLSNRTPLVRTPVTEREESRMVGLSVGESEQHASSSDDNLNIGEEEVVTTLPIFLPTYTTPSHSLEPIVVTHRIRWTVAMTNLDGHLSELRCSLPLYVLDHALLEDARLATRATRRLLFGLEDSQSHTTEEIELPSYPAHVLDRIANAYLPSTIPVSNSETVLSPVSETTSPRTSLSLGPRDISASRYESSNAIELDWVNLELHRVNRARQRPAVTITPPGSTPGSRHASRASSRAASPERGGGNGRERSHHHHSHHNIFCLKSFTKVASSLNPSQGKNHGATADSPTHSPRSTHPSTESPDAASGGSGSGSGSPSPSIPRRRLEELHAAVALDSAFNEVPNYNVASRGFLGGGVTPLSSTRGLPSYEEAKRSGSEGDLAARFAAARLSA